MSLDDETGERFIFTARATKKLDLVAVGRCWNRVSKDPPRYWKAATTPDGRMVPYFECKDRGRLFFLVMREDDDGSYIWVCLPEDVAPN